MLPKDARNCMEKVVEAESGGLLLSRTVTTALNLFVPVAIPVKAPVEVSKVRPGGMLLIVQV